MGYFGELEAAAHTWIRCGRYLGYVSQRRLLQGHASLTQFSGYEENLLLHASDKIRARKKNWL